MGLIINPYVFASSALPGGAIAQFDARSLLGADNTAISQWDDTSGNARNALQSNPPQRPTVQTNELNGLQIARWTASAELLDFSSLGASLTAYTLIAVIKCTGSASPRTVLSAGTGGIFGAIPSVWISSNKVEIVNTDVAILATSATSLSTSTFFTIAATYNCSTGAYAFYLNGSADGSGTATAVTFAPFLRIGCRNGNQNSFLGDFAYVSWWDSILSGSTLTAIFNELRTTWGHY